MSRNDGQLDELDAAERAMTPGPWQTRFMYRQAKAARKDRTLLMGTEPEQDWPDAEGITELRNHARALIDIARAAARHHGSPHEFPPGHLDGCDICAALARLEAE